MDDAAPGQPRWTPCGSHASAPWFCLRSKPNQGPIAVSELRNQGFPAFLPLRAGARGIEFLFPGYLFAQPVDDVWAPMRYTRGVLDILMTSPSRPAVVPAQAMALLFDRLSDDGILWPEPSRIVEVGDQFKVDADHPFADFALACTRRSQDRVFALLTVLGRSLEVSFHRSEVKAV